MTLSAGEQRELTKIRYRIEDVERKAEKAIGAHEFLFEQPFQGRPSRAERLDDFLFERQARRRFTRGAVRIGAGVTTLVVGFEAIKRFLPMVQAWLSQ